MPGPDPATPAREQAGLTGHLVAERTGVTSATLSRLERGQNGYATAGAVYVLLGDPAGKRAPWRRRSGSPGRTPPDSTGRPPGFSGAATGRCYGG
ncbi:helix-turn-helix domain-containing protein [Nonomuraea muscovyensis]|uniref:helix-turn-helix domain-containing protein n=1 Tax=Nonomuraea muscovyensis TaxID=1124761 RepID=UPI0035E3FCA3